MPKEKTENLGSFIHQDGLQKEEIKQKSHSESKTHCSFPFYHRFLWPSHSVELLIMWSSTSVSSSSMSSENLPPRTLARVSREVRDMMKKVPEGTKLIVDTDTGLPQNLGEIMVSLTQLFRYS